MFSLAKRASLQSGINQGRWYNCCIGSVSFTTCMVPAASLGKLRKAYSHEAMGYTSTVDTWQSFRIHVLLKLLIAKKIEADRSQSLSILFASAACVMMT